MNDNTLDCMRYAGMVNIQAIEYGFEIAEPGMTLRQIDEAIENVIRGRGCKPAFKNYQPDGYESPFPAAACISPNDVVVHGIPDDYVLRDGDLITIDVGTEYQGAFVDSARSRVICGHWPAKHNLDSLHKEQKSLVLAAEAVLWAQLSVIKDQCDFLTMVMVAEETALEYNVTIMPQWGGHGIGLKVHTEPFIPSAIDRRQSPIRQRIEEKRYSRQKLTEGQTICVEPVVTFGTPDIMIGEDKWTVRQANGELAAHTERCLLVTKDGYELLS